MEGNRDSQAIGTAGQALGMMPKGALQYHAGSLRSHAPAGGWDGLVLGMARTMGMGSYSPKGTMMGQVML